MKKFLFILISLFLFVCISFVRNSSPTGAPPYYIDESQITPNLDNYSWLTEWRRPDGPPRVGLQVGHWKNDEIPEELRRLRGNTGSQGGGKVEWEVNHTIAVKTQEILEDKGIVVDILPATIPKSYWADVFIAIHSDGSTDPQKSGFKVAPPRRDYTSKAESLSKSIEEEYQRVTMLKIDENITRNMRGYYAFSFWRFEHAVHPMTVSSILETGFLTNFSDRTTIVDQPEVSAQGLANGIIRYLENEKLL